ncbi:nucleoside triphosphate pyrophosphohydrolase [Candidatus Woesearchaeota archaeon]|jgi:predicted house-cleaning noncanonical NTP pyrophosphatase (MazG superfamily)|nr:nucleoside triphosphate pyrophosphohydrolase [Candidatus Woesearchaeota archaeon]
MKPKLVRDKIPEIIKADGRIPLTRIAEPDEYWIKLREKLVEEVDEFLESEKKEELADIVEVIKAICDYKNLGFDQLRVIRKKKVEERGKFEKRIILERID